VKSLPLVGDTSSCKPGKKRGGFSQTLKKAHNPGCFRMISVSVSLISECRGTGARLPFFGLRQTSWLPPCRTKRQPASVSSRMKSRRFKSLPRCPSFARRGVAWQPDPLRALTGKPPDEPALIRPILKRELLHHWVPLTSVVNIAHAERAGNARYPPVIPNSALITIDAMPTGIITFQPMFINWS